MFGYVTINKGSLPEGEYDRFRGWYCGLCRALRLQHGSLSRIWLTYDMTFLYLLLSALYEPETETLQERCVMQPVKPHQAFSNRLAEYAADMNLMLAYFQCRDDAADDKSPAGYAGAALMKKRFQEVAKRWPRQYEAARSAIERLSCLEKENAEGPDAPANLMGELLGEIYALHDDFFAPELRQMGRAMGRYVYLLDAYCDLEKDKKSGNYNPLIPLQERPDFEDYVLSVLKMMIADCADAFERLPILTDASLIRNILYSGVWSGYAQAYRKRTEKDEKHE